MAVPYNHHEVEQKWQKYWAENETFKTDVWDFSKPKYYALDMFPYPSGVGLHAGHPEGYTATDIMSRMKSMQGYNVLHPMGYDSFGLPAEQYAVSTGNHPNGFTQKNIETFSKQLKELGFDYDWSKMIATSDPEFYKWTQWIFKQLYLDGYAKYVDMPVNWCEELGTVLSNDEVIDGKSERGGYPVIRKNMKQWVINQPAFAEKLLEGLEEIDWPESTKDIQRHWIGKSEGVEVDFEIVGGGNFSIYTTCIETIYGITFMVLAPDGQIVKDLMPRVQNPEEVQAYIDETLKKNDMDRTELNKTKSGCILKGLYAINPVNGKEVPLFIGDFVLASYGTGAVMAVPSHDQRDFEYAVAHNIPMIQVIDGGDVSECAFEKGSYLGKGCKLMNSEEFTGLTVEEAKSAITEKLVKMGVATETTNYRLRDWSLFFCILTSPKFDGSDKMSKNKKKSIVKKTVLEVLFILISLVQMLLIVLKLSGVFAYGWIWVLMPVICPVSLLLLYLIFLIAYGICVVRIHDRRNKQHCTNRRKAEDIVKDLRI